MVCVTYCVSAGCATAVSGWAPAVTVQAHIQARIKDQLGPGTSADT